MILVPVGKLRTTLAPLRGERTDRSDLAALPLRVAAAGDGYEVIDGFMSLVTPNAPLIFGLPAPL